MLLPRFVQEGKKYASIAIGCTGGRHRSVRIVQLLAERLREIQPADGAMWRVAVTHRELVRDLPQNGANKGVGQEANQGGPEQAVR
jgi:UPF0042 nucleotide-binding protein